MKRIYIDTDAVLFNQNKRPAPDKMRPVMLCETVVDGEVVDIQSSFQLSVSGPCELVYRPIPIAGEGGKRVWIETEGEVIAKPMKGDKHGTD